MNNYNNSINNLSSCHVFSWQLARIYYSLYLILRVSFCKYKVSSFLDFQCLKSTFFKNQIKAWAIIKSHFCFCDWNHHCFGFYFIFGPWTFQTCIFMLLSSYGLLWPKKKVHMDFDTRLSSIFGIFLFTFFPNSTKSLFYFKMVEKIKIN